MTRVQQIREEQALSRAELATLAGITERTIHLIETRTETVKVQDRIRRGIVAALGVNHSTLFNKHGQTKTT
jgi:DNA-binding XRE family transcriptional regulator